MKWWRCLLAAMLVELLGASAAVAKDKDPQTAIARAHFEEGEKHYRLGHFDQALAAYEQAYLAKPLAEFAPLLVRIGRVRHLDVIADHDIGAAASDVCTDAACQKRWITMIDVALHRQLGCRPLFTTVR